MPPQGRMLIVRACDYIMGCCQSVSGAGRELGAWRCWQGGAGGWKTLKTSKVGIMAPELGAYDFASEDFPRAYLEQPVTPNADPRRSEELGDFTARGDVQRKGTLRRVPEDYATIQDALDSAQPGDVSVCHIAAPPAAPPPLLPALATRT